MLDKFLEKFNLKYEELTPEERATLHNMVDSVSQAKLTTEKIKDYIQRMRDSVEQELTKESMKNPSFWGFMAKYRKDIHLKARLRNYMLLLVMFDTPKKAKQALEQALASVGKH